MAEDRERMQLRSMADKEGRSNPSEGAAQNDSQGPTTQNSLPDPIDGLDDIDRAVRISTKKVRKFWYIPDLKNTQLRNIADSRLPHPSDPLEILINAPELKKFFKTSTFEICIDNGKMYTYTDAKVDIGVSLESDPFDIDTLEDHFREHTKVVEVKHQMERIPLMERTTSTTEVMPLKEFESNIRKFFKLCQMYRKASCELSRRSSGSEEETTRAYNALQPYISDILEQIGKGQAVFRIESEIRNHKGRGRLRKEKLINNAKQLQEFMEAVDEDLKGVIESVREQEEEFENREQARREEDARQEQIRQNTRPTGLSYQTTTSSPLRTQLPYATQSQNRQTNRGVLFDPNPTHHSYAHTM